MNRARIVALVLALATAGGAAGLAEEAPAETALRFEVTVGKGLLAGPTDGRVLVVLGKRASPEPRLTIGNTDSGSPPVIAADGDKLVAGGQVVLDGKCVTYPMERLGELPRGEYHVQAVFDYNPDLRLPNAPGNLSSDVKKVTLDPAKSGTVALELARKLPDEKLPADTKSVKYLKFKSDKLSKFHGRPMYLRVGVVLPPGHDQDADRKYPLRVHIGGFGSRYTGAGYMRPSPGMITLFLDGCGPLGDPYQVDSANHGPYGAAITQELIPHVEKAYRGLGEGWARVLDGSSTGGWVSLALQIFYPDFFNGTWSHCPDPVDFRAYELINLYKDANAFVNRHGHERPASRDLSGEVRTTVRGEVRVERVLGRGGDWTLSGKDWASWNATFGGRRKDGRPVPVWDGATGQIDRAAVNHWEDYDLRLRLARNWDKLGPKLHGKINIFVGDQDEYFLNNAVDLLDDFFKAAKPAFGGRVVFGRRAGHGWRGQTNAKMLEEMLAAVERGRKAAGK